MHPICRNDAAWGPFVRGCRHDFDFTVTFEHVIVPVPLSLLAVVLLGCRARQLWHRPRIVTPGWPHACKRCAYLLLAACHVGALAVCATLHTPESHAYIASGSLASLVALLLIPIAHLEARCSLRPPVAVQAYLVLDASWRAVQVRTSWLVASSSTFTLYAALSSAIVLLDLIALLLEYLPHRVATSTLPRSQEEEAGLFSLASFAWLLPLLRTGYVKPLLLSDLDGSTSPPQINLVRARTSIRSLRSLGAPLLLPLLATVLPRALLAVFSFAQVFLLNAILQHLRGPADADTRKVGWALVGATFLVYAGSATATTWYWYSHERVLSLGRSILIEALYTHTLTRTVEMVSEAEGLTLMGTEVERVRVGFAGLHDLWCCPLEAAFALWMLYRRLGPAAAAPLVLVCFVTACIGLLGRVIPRHQRAWIHARQRRTMLTANLVSDIECLQTTQLADAAEACVQLLREHEIDIGQRYRLLQLLIVTLAFVPTHLSPALTFAFTGSDLTVSTMFQSVALMMLIATPLAQLFQRTPPFLAACACLGRMQGYLRAEQKIDLRHFERYPSHSLASCAAITIAGCDIGWGDTAPVLHNLHASLPRGRLTIIYGPTGSGKSTLCRTLLGECAYAGGRIVIRGEPSQAMGFCEQDPVLLGGTIMDNIVGFAVFDQHLYHDITCAVMLREDFRQMEHGDQTDIGSNGANLSGGQRKRVALARALYQSTGIYILDEILGGLDSKTAQHVFDNVLGPEGLLKRRGATAVFATSSRQYLHAADHVIHLSHTPDPPCDARDGLTDANMGESVARDALSSQQASSTQVPCDSSPDSLALMDEAHRIHVECRRSTIEKPSDVLNEKEDDDSRYASSTLSEAASKHTPAVDNNLLLYAYYLRASGKVPLVLFISSALVYAFCSNFSTAWLSFWAQDRLSQSKSLYLGIFSLLKASTLIFLFASMTTCLMLMMKISSREIHRDTLQALVQAPLRLFSDMNQGEITTLFSQDLNIIDSELPQAAMNAVLNTVVAIGLTAVLAIASPYILISLPVIFLVLWIVQRVYLRTARRLRVLDLEAKEPLYTHFLATVRSISTIRAFCWQRHFVKLNNGMIDTSQRAAYVLAMVQRWLDYVLGMVVTGMATILVALAVNLRSDAAITGASLLSLLSLGEALSAVVEFSSRMDIAMGTVGRLRAFASGAQIKEEGHGDEIESCWPSQGEIAVLSVSASYDDGDSTMKKRRPSEHRRHSHLALHDVTFSVPAACKVAIVGRSGSGKSTLFRLLLRLLDPLPSTSHRESTILVDNVPLSRIPRSLVRERIIAIPQRSVLLPDSTFRQNIDPYNQCSQECCLEALDVVGLANPVRNRGGLDSKVSADMLSHGELQSLGLARALLRKKQADERRAKAAARFHATTDKLDTAAAAAMVGQGARASGGILLVDEVGSALDAEMYDRLWKIIRREFQSYTVVAIVHRLDPVALEFFDKVLVMEHGELVEGGGECPSEF